MKSETIKITGMSCGGCAINVAGALKALEGVNDAHVSLETKEAMVNYDEDKVSTQQLKSAVRHAGYGVED
ncbi:MAG TPA: heavy-metal-associated domain-containing protein [Methylophilaceae bacterium]|nr:heavy-metal-associated domain-containing protein [Methylophilaceae bacterium]